VLNKHYQTRRKVYQESGGNITEMQGIALLPS
jgi:hypothetical protein